MKQQQVSIPGIVGGLGPSAHVYFEQLLLRLSSSRGARSDQEYPRWVLISATDTPDRSKSILSNNRECYLALSKTCLALEAMGANFIVVPCNTAHVFHTLVQQRLAVPWVNIIDTFADYVKTNLNPSVKLGLMATTGTLQSGLYQHALSMMGFEVIVPEGSLQESVMEAIYAPEFGIKSTVGQISTEAHRRLGSCINKLKNAGAEAIIAGCTEISVAFSEGEEEITILDPLYVLAEFTINTAFGETTLKHLTATNINKLYLDVPAAS
jgi:aspartate racemase